MDNFSFPGIERCEVESFSSKEILYSHLLLEIKTNLKPQMKYEKLSVYSKENLVDSCFKPLFILY